MVSLTQSTILRPKPRTGFVWAPADFREYPDCEQGLVRIRCTVVTVGHLKRACVPWRVPNDATIARDPLARDVWEYNYGSCEGAVSMDTEHMRRVMWVALGQDFY